MSIVWLVISRCPTLIQPIESAITSRANPHDTITLFLSDV